jgi:pimeloyl-ACP methyl ester carboxylesterase
MLALYALGLGLIHSWFDPLQRWGLHAADTEQPKQLLAYIPGLDGGNGSPFVHFPSLSDSFKVRVQDVCFSPGASAASFGDIVEDVASFLRSESAESDARGSLLMGESYGGVIAAGVALAHPNLVRGLILVNPATAVSVMPELQEDIRYLRSGSIPDALLPLVLFVKVGSKTFDLGFVATAVREIFVEKKMQRLRETAPELARYYDSALADFVGQLTSLKEASFWRGRLAQLVHGCAHVELRLRKISPPTLIVAGTADVLLNSEAEAARLARLLPVCDVELVAGAGHAGTLDQRVDLPSVVRAWASKRGI